MAFELRNLAASYGADCAASLSSAPSFLCRLGAVNNGAGASSNAGLGGAASATGDPWGDPRGGLLSGPGSK